MHSDDETTSRAGQYHSLIVRYLAGDIDGDALQDSYFNMWRSDRDTIDATGHPMNDDLANAINRGFTCIEDWLDRDDLQNNIGTFHSELQDIADELRRVITSSA